MTTRAPPLELTKAAAAGAVGPLADRIVDLSQRLGVTQGAAVTMLQIIGQQDVPLERLPQKLVEVAEQYKSAMERLAGLDPQDPATRDLVEHAEAALKSGHLDEADQLFNSANQIQEDRFAADSLLEGDGFELSVPRERGHRFELLLLLCP